MSRQTTLNFEKEKQEGARREKKKKNREKIGFESVLGKGDD